MQVSLGSAAEGVLRVGDRLVAINGVDARRLSHADAQEVFRRAGNSLNLGIARLGSFPGGTRGGGGGTCTVQCSTLNCATVNSATRLIACNVFESHFEILLHKSPRFGCAPRFVVQFSPWHTIAPLTVDCCARCRHSLARPTHSTQHAGHVLLGAPEQFLNVWRRVTCRPPCWQRAGLLDHAWYALHHAKKKMSYYVQAMWHIKKKFRVLCVGRVP